MGRPDVGRGHSGGTGISAAVRVLLPHCSGGAGRQRQHFDYREDRAATLGGVAIVHADAPSPCRSGVAV